MVERAALRRGGGWILGLGTAALAVVLLVAGGPAGAANGGGKGLWKYLDGKPSPARPDTRPAVKPQKFAAFELDRAGMAGLLETAPAETAPVTTNTGLVISLPDPSGDFQAFAIEESPVMEPGLGAKHPEIATYAGRGLDDTAATIRLDLTPLGFHASVRSPRGNWYIDPYYRLDDSVYASYYGRSLREEPEGIFVERDADAAELSVDNGYYHADGDVTLTGSGFRENAAVTISITDPEGGFASRTLSVRTDAAGAFTATFVADPDGNLETHIVTADDGSSSASTSYQVVRSDDPTTDPPTGDVVRTYRLALITDPGYAAYHGGAANVTAAKVTLMNRVNQVYEDDLSIHMNLVANNDLLNLNTWDTAIAPNGPCGAAACFTQAQVTGCSSTARARFVIGQIIGASNYDIGHLALGQPGGGVANLGVVGRANKAGGCTGIPTPIGDFYAIDYVAHEMGHQFAGNHTFNGNQLNCSGGNRSNATSVEPGSGSSVMAYAGICLTDDLQPHSDPYFSQRSLQEISTYTSSGQAAINEVQTASLRHFGGGNEVQVVTFGPGYAPANTIQPLTLNINAAPSATSRGGAEEVGNTVTIATSAVHTLQVGDTVTVAGVGVAGFNGTWTVTAVPSTRSFQFTNPTAGLAISGGGTVTLNAPGATESGTTATIRTSLAHGRSVGDWVTISGVGVAGYNGTFQITGVPTPRSFEYTAPVSGLASSGGGSSTFFSPFKVRVGGSDSAVIGGSGQPYNNANLTAAINAIPGFAGTVTVTGAASTGFTVTYGGAAAGTDVANIELVDLACNGCFSSVEETNHGGANDSFTLNYGGAVSAPIVNGVNFTAAGIQAALAPLLPSGATATVAGFGNGAFNTGFQVTFGGTLAQSNVPVTVAVQDFSAGASGFVGETDKGGAVDNKGGTVTPTGNAFPTVTVPAEVAIPLRTPFALTGGATDGNGDALTFIWEQNDRGAAPNAAGTSLLGNTKTNGPLFAMFPKSGLISETDTLLYNSPGENHVTASPTRVFPDLDQILDGNTNAETGACPTGPIAPPVPVPVKECFSEFLPTADYVGVAGVNASPLSLHFRLTARDGKGGVNAADATVLIATNAGPFLVTSHAAADSLRAGSTQTVTWNVANTTAAPLNTANVRISLSTDGGHTYPHVLAASTPNDGSQAVVLPNVGTTEARIKVEAVDGIFFDVSNADLEIRDAATQLAELVSFSTGLGTGNALEQLARAAQRQLQKGNVADACDTLQSFLNQVKAQTGKSLTPAQAAELTLRATTIRTALGC
jgi:Metallo-peptidase family M12B Reprolysin-like